jgi:hypothetical protein
MLRYVYCLKNIFLCLFCTQKIIQRFARNPLTAFNDKLKADFIYAWSLPTDPTFERKMAVIGAAINEATASPLHDYPRCQVFYFTRKIHDAVRVSCPFQNISLSKLTISFTRNVSNCTICKCVQLRHLLQSSRMRSWLPRLVP